MRKLSLLLVLGVVGCKGMVSVDAIRPGIEQITARHDAYVATDEKLSAADKATYTRTSEMLRKVLDEASK